EEKKAEGKKMEEKKQEEAKEEKKEEPKAEVKKEEMKAEEPPQPQEIVLRVYMHCEGCARKVRRCLKGFEGVEDVVTDCKTHKVVVKGEKADPVKVLERVQRKSHRQVELISPIPKPPAPEEKAVPKVVEKKEEPPLVTVVLKVHMHCEACAQEIKKRMLRMNGVESVEPDLKSSQVTVKGVVDPPKLVDFVYKKTGKHALIVKQEPEKKEEEKGKEEKPKEEKGKEEKPKEEKKAEDGGGDKDAKKVEEAAKGGDAAAAAVEVGEGEREGEGETANVVQLKKNEFYSNYPQNYHIYAYPPPRYEMNAYPPQMFSAYPPQMFSDENPNACSVM
ncbi:Heavy metal-associated isoprenylated plant protein, partial [Actinidia chinensis var. chinensis]